MGKIITLEKRVYEKIAAGEVVENPFSVVKELLENSIDAGAGEIRIELIAGGKELIRIVDNGFGFNEDDIEIAFKRHSTSKFKDFSDFENLDTLGFRGEALPSILEVSKIELTTSNNENGEGILCRFNDGKLIEKESISFPRGTSFTVKNLFYNYPVRKKFLKGDRSEFNKIVTYLESTVLAHFDKTFELFHNGKSVFYYEKVKDIEERIYQVFGKEFSSALIPLSFSDGVYFVKGLVSKINTGLNSKKYQYFFVNGRNISERTLFASLNNTFKSFLEKSRSPAAILLFNIPPSEVDVNIHPMKLEIKFADTQKIYRFLHSAIKSLFSIPVRVGNSAGLLNLRNSKNDIISGTGEFNKIQTSQPALFEQDDLDIDDFFVIGQYQNSYIVVEKDGDLLIVDQHNADERANFDKLKKRFKERKIISVSPLFPLILELSPSETSLFDDKKAEMLMMSGFEISPLSGNSYDIKKYPDILSERSVKETVKNIIYKEFSETEFEDKMLAEIACKSSIKVNYPLHLHQMKRVVRELFKSSNPNFCPHKRPIITCFTLEKIERLLKRR